MAKRAKRAKKAFVYAGEGAHPFSVQETCHSLKEELPGVEVSQVSLDDLLAGILDDAVLFVMPGGRDVPYHEKLKGEGNRRIRHFVEGGGSYLGICAGAYYASQEVAFEVGLPLEVQGTRELAFFPGRAVGTLFQKGLFAYDSKQGACPAPLLFKDRLLYAYYNGGCYFAGSHAHSDSISLIASYEANAGPEEPRPAAVIACQVGKGRAVLSGVHLEFAASRLKNLPFLKTLEDFEFERHRLWQHLLKELVLKPGQSRR